MTAPTAAPNPIVLLLEKVGFTFVEVFLTVLITMGSFGANALKAAGIAAFSAGVTVVANRMPAPPTGQSALVDLFYRVVYTYVAAAAGLLAAIPLDQLNITTGQAALYAAIPAGLAIVKGWAASHAGARDTAALLPASVDASANQFALAA